MRDIATFPQKNLDVSTPINLHGPRFSRVTQKTEWMTRNVNNIQLPVFQLHVDPGSGDACIAAFT